MPEESAGERKVSQEEARLVSLAKRFIRQTSVATKNFRMFSETHPFLKSSVTNACELLKSILLIKENATFTFQDTSCLLEDIPIKNLDIKTYSFLNTAKECGITSLTFSNGLTDDELQAVLKLVSDGPNAIKKEGGLAGFINTKNISHIKADEVFFKKVSKKDEESREAKKHLEDFLIVNYLMGKAAMSRDDISSLVGEVTIDPKRMGKILSDVAMNGPGSGGTGSGGSGSGIGTGGGGSGGTSDPDGEGVHGLGSGSDDKNFDGIDFAKAGIEKIAVNIKNIQGKPYEDVKKHIGSLIMAMEPSIRGEILKSKIPVSGTSDDMISDILREVSDDVVMELIVSDVIGKKLSIVRVKKLIQRMIPDPAKRAKIFPILEERLVKKGVSQEVCSKLLEDKFWMDMNNEEKARQVSIEHPLFAVEIGLSDEINKLIENLLTEKKFDTIKILIEKVFDNLASNDAGMKIRVLRDIKNTYMLLLQAKEYPHKEELLDIIRSEFQKNPDGAIRERFLGMLSDSVKLCLKNKWYSHLPPLIRVVGYKNLKSSMSSEIKIEDLFRELISDNSLDKRYVESIAKEMGEDAKMALRNILMSIVNDDFESYRERRNITLILKDLGEDIEEIFIKELSSGKIEILKNSLEALCEIGTERSSGAVEKLTQHPDSEISNRAMTALKRIRSRK